MLLACALYMVHMYIPSRQMLQAASNIAPRGVYVCGNTTTTSGLTVTLAREGGGSGDFALEAGALVLADQGHYFHHIISLQTTTTDCVLVIDTQFRNLSSLKST